jgi:predicted dehydrogenase
MNNVNPMNDGPIRAGIAGLGRSGWGIHANALSTLPDLYRLAAVSDPDEGRRREAEARFGCRAHGTFESLIADQEIELVVIATPNHLHVQHVIAALDAERHVVCEKPVATSSGEMSRLSERARHSSRRIAPFQNRRYEAMYRQVCDVIGSGVLGRIVEIRVSVHGFERRWDWQTLREYGGGALRNIGSHFIDELLAFVPDDRTPDVFCRLDRTLTSGDAEDHVMLILHAPDAPLIDLEISSACAFPQEMWLVMGTRGGLVSQGSDTLRWRYVDFGGLPARPVDPRPTPDRKYNSEALPWQEQQWTMPPDVNIFQTHRLFYQDLYRSVRGGAAFPITLKSVARQISIMEKCYAQNDR